MAWPGDEAWPGAGAWPGAEAWAGAEAWPGAEAWAGDEVDPGLDEVAEVRVCSVVCSVVDVVMVVNKLREVWTQD